MRRGELAADDGREVVADVVAAPAHPTGQLADRHDEAGLLGDLAGNRLLVRLARLDPPAGQRPQAATGFVAALDQQQPAVGAGDDRARRSGSARRSVTVTTPSQ